MPKLNQIIAMANGAKGRAQKSITEVYHKIQKAELLQGISRRYRPKDEEGEHLPPESKCVHYRVEDAIRDTADALVTLFDVVATQDAANCLAMADVVVNDKVILSDVPVTNLLFLEKQLIDIHTLVEKLPTLDTSEEWTESQEACCYASEKHETVRTKKVPHNHVRVEATKEHPAQVDVYYEDVTVGYWETVKFSGAIPEAEKQLLLSRVRKLQDAVKMAREEANSLEVEKKSIGRDVFGYLFGTFG